MLRKDNTTTINIDKPQARQFISPKNAGKVTDSVVFITGQRCGERSNGTGWIIAKNLIATSAHVVLGMDKVTVAFGRGKIIDSTQNKISFKSIQIARVVGFDRKKDIALLEVNTGDLPVLPLALDDTLHKTSYYSWGHPRTQPLEISPLRGINTTDIENRDEVYVLAGNVEPGDSGLPMFNADGEVMGIVYATQKGKLAFVTPLKPVIKLLKKAARDNFETKGTADCDTIITT